MDGSSIVVVQARSIHSVGPVSKTKVKLGNGQGRGSVAVPTKKRGVRYIQNVLYIPSLDPNLLSVAQMITNGYCLNF